MATEVTVRLRFKDEVDVPALVREVVYYDALEAAGEVEDIEVLDAEEV